MDDIGRIGDLLTGIGTVMIAGGAIWGGWQALQEYKNRGKVERVR